MMASASPSWFSHAVGTLLLCALASSAAAEMWPEVPMPPQAQAQWVAQSMRVNGVPTRVLQFQSRASRQDVVAYYRSYWTGGYKLAPSVRPLGDATIVGQMHGPYLMTVKVEDGPHGTSKGLISTAQVMGFTPDRGPGPELPLMDGAKVVSVVESDDPGKHSREVTIVTPQPLSSVTHFYQASLVNAGWRQLQDSSASGAGSKPTSGSVLVFARDANEMIMSVTNGRSGRGCLVVANLVTKDTGPGRD